MNIRNINIVDTQIHMGPNGIQETLCAMDALGIKSVLVDEFWVSCNPMETRPNNIHIQKGIRPICPSAELAAELYPERFGWIRRIFPDDPEFAALIHMAKDSTTCKAIRITPGMHPMTIAAFGNGNYDHILAEAEKVNIPVCIYLPDQPEMLAQTAQKFPKLTIIVDHCGLCSNLIRTALMEETFLNENETQKLLDSILTLTKYPNIIFKWSHYSENFDIPAFPGQEMSDMLRKAIDAFGSDRIIWASDYSVNQRDETWGELLYGQLNNTNLTQEETEKIMGKNARRIFQWEIV